MTAIEVRDLRKRYGDVAALRGVGFTVEPGEVFCLLGPNGAGKTTATEIVEGHRLADSGEVRVLGHDPGRGERALRERIGVVLQSCGVQDELTVAELIEMYGRWYERPRPADELIELVRLDAKRDTRAKELSGGQRRRLDLALGLVGDPDVLFLDEPTTGFDPQARRQAWSTIRDLCAFGKTVFLTTHFMDEAQALADRVAVMVAGEIVAAGTPAELGGRDALPTEIRFTLPGEIGLADLPPLPAASVHERDGDVLVTTGEGLAATHALTGWALERGWPLRGLAVAQPSLEDVYLALTRDAGADAAADDPPAHQPQPVEELTR
ncbi:MAG TPA: ABC transporter ATP-binding protein [Conexibacter sp.]|jgi:ABC-2 type transport system ATP-binding protein|nr:ABC transporter ATP-binding protein [Conexibacter sp.]